LGAGTRLIQDDGGIHIVSSAIDYYIKWAGITRLFIEPDGVVITHGILFWFVPDNAFPSPADRLGFVRDVYSRLSDEARAISEGEIKPLLEREDSAKPA
jgi:hypothetical protein